MATTLKILNSSGGETGSIELVDTWLERDKGDQAIHDSVVAFLAWQRAGTASTKTRAEVKGTGAKPYRQKGTGRARAGNTRSPIWRGGGIAFGPKPRSFAKRVNRKVRKLALRRAFTERLDEDNVIIVDGISLDEAKTKRMSAFLTAIGAGHDVLVVVDEITADVHLAARNLPGVEVMKALAVNTYWMLLFKKVVITQAALDVLGTRIDAVENER